MRGRAPILIAGAGIAGLASAIALRMAGFEVTVLEREETLRPAGAGIQLGPNATRLLAGWDVDLPSACEPERLVFRNMRSGRVVKAMPLGQEARARYGAPYFTLSRTDLQKALLDRANAAGAEFRYSAPVLSFADDENGLTVETANGALRGLALVAADGVRSAIRIRLWPDVRPVPTHATAWRTLLKAEAWFGTEFAENAIGVWMGSGAHLVHYPVDCGAAVNIVLVVADDWRALEANDPDTRRFLRRRFSDCAPRVVELAGAPQDWWRVSIHTLPQLRRWSAGKVCLVGDAAHAISPHLASGGAMAIEDAAILAASFTATEGNPEAAFAMFYRKRRARLARAAYRAQLMGRIYQFPEPGAHIRDAIMSALPPGALLAANDWLYAGPR